MTPRAPEHISVAEYRRLHGIPQAIPLAGLKRDARGSYTPGRMNKTEARYSQFLGTLQLAGNVTAFYHEPERQILTRAAPDNGTKNKKAKGSTFCPDFLVVFATGRQEYHEVKGSKRVTRFQYTARWEEDARGKIKFAAAKFRGAKTYKAVWFNPYTSCWEEETF